MNTNTKFSQRGLGVIEVMVAAAIFAIGIVALIQLQGVFFKNSSAAQSRSVAATLAEEKLEDLRSFDDGSSFSYLNIVDNGGGDLSSGTQTIGNTDYTLSWDVTGYYYNAGVLTSIDPSDADVEHKSVVISVSWVDNDGTAHDGTDEPPYTLEALINSNAGTSGGLLANNSGGSGEKPDIPHTELAAPEVLRVKVKEPPPETFEGTDAEWNNLTDNERAEEYARLGWCNVQTFGATESPDPDLNTNNTLDNVIVRFASTKYRKFNPCTLDEYNNDIVNQGVSELVKIKEEEFLTINCECELAGSDAGFDQSGASVTKARTGTPTGNNQSDFCTLCCRDHHENTSGEYLCNSGSNPEYCIDPYRDQADFADSDHNHYTYDDLLNPVAIGGTYNEVCRIKRIDGFYRVIPDWLMIAHNVVVESDYNDNSFQLDYESYNGTQINQYILGNPVVPWASASSAVPLNNEQMMSRSIYVDYLAVAPAGTAGDEVDFNVDFYEYNTTALSDWSTQNSISTDTQLTTPCDPTNNSSVNACTDSPSVKDVAQDNDDKGIYRYDASVSGDIEIVSTMQNSNSGVVSEPAIDPGSEHVPETTATYDIAYGAGPPPADLSVRMASTPTFTCPSTWSSGPDDYNRTSVSAPALDWALITLSCSPSSDGGTSCVNYADPASGENVSVSAALNTASLSCSYENVADPSDTFTESCPSINGLTSGSEQLDITGTFSCSIEAGKSGNSLSCDLACQ